MPKLKLTGIVHDKPIKLTIELPAIVHRDLVAYAEILARDTGVQTEPTKLIAPMLSRFMATDRAFSKARRNDTTQELHSRSPSLGRGARSS
jgi:hypothetical protein